MNGNQVKDIFTILESQDEIGVTQDSKTIEINIYEFEKSEYAKAKLTNDEAFRIATEIIRLVERKT